MPGDLQYKTELKICGSLYHDLSHLNSCHFSKGIPWLALKPASFPLGMYQDRSASIHNQYTENTQNTAADPGAKKYHTGSKSAHWDVFSLTTGKAHTVSGWIPSLQLLGIQEVCTNKKTKLCASQTMFLPSKIDLYFTHQPCSFGASAWFSLTQNIRLAFLIWKEEKTGRFSFPCLVPSALLMLYSYTGKQPRGYAAVRAAQISAGSTQWATKLSASSNSQEMTIIAPMNSRNEHSGRPSMEATRTLLALQNTLTLPASQC